MSSSPDAASIFGAAIAEHLEVVRQVEAQQPVLEAIARAMTATLRAGGKILWCGNGGSAGDSQHLAAELVGRFRRERRGLASLALTTDSSVLTSMANDYGYEAVFSRQVEALGVAGDLLVGISTSGNSRNVLCRTGGGAQPGAGDGGVYRRGRRQNGQAGRSSLCRRFEGDGAHSGGAHTGWAHALRLDRAGLHQQNGAGERCGAADRRSCADRGGAVIEQLHEVIQEIEQKWADQASAGGGRRDARQVHLGRGGPHLAGGAGARGACDPPEPSAGRRGQRGHEPEPVGRAGRGDRVYRRRRGRTAAGGGTAREWDLRRSSWFRRDFPPLPSSAFWVGGSRCCALDSERSGRAVRRTTIERLVETVLAQLPAAMRWCSPTTRREC